MTTLQERLSRRSFLSLTAVAPLAAALPLRAQQKRIPVGLELYSVREELKQDLMGTVRAVAGMGYEVVEFFSPYYQWETAYAKEVRKLLDDLGISCPSTHNGANVFEPGALDRAIELNQILGSKLIVMASAGRGVEGVSGWQGVAERLTRASEKLTPLGMAAGFHNHATEFRAIEGADTRPMDVLAANTPPAVTLQLDVGTCVEAKADPVAWIRDNPGRIRSIHCKDWGPDECYKVLFGEGTSPWKDIFTAAESVGGIEHYLIEQEGSRFPPMETAQRCLDNYRQLRGLASASR
jgi:sugar phosphate isomerase/epimerase